jgi:hypothetical protein
MLFTNITGKKETKGFHKEQVIVCPTPGEFRLTPKVQAKLDVENGDFGIVVISPDNTGLVYIAKGIRGKMKTDSEGNPIRDKRKRYVYEDNTGFGATLRTASEGSPNLKLTAAAAWNTVGGDKNKNKFFKLGEPVEGEVETTLKDENGEYLMHKTLFYPLIFEEEVDKMVRVEGVNDQDEDEDNDDEETFSLEDSNNGTDTQVDEPQEDLGETTEI